jgi:hypothetical protein
LARARAAVAHRPIHCINVVRRFLKVRREGRRLTMKAARMICWLFVLLLTLLPVTSHTARPVFAATRLYTVNDLGASLNFAYGLNNRGQVVGRVDLPTGDSLPVLWDRGVATQLPSLGGSFSQALGIDDSAHAPIFLSGSGTAVLVSSKTTRTEHVNGVTLTSYAYVWKFSGVLNGLDHDFSNTITYPDGTSIVAGVDACICTAGGLSGTITDPYYGSDNGTVNQGPATWGPGTGGFAGIHGSGSWIGSDKDYNHFKFTLSAVVPWK